MLDSASFRSAILYFIVCLLEGWLDDHCNKASDYRLLCRGDRRCKGLHFRCLFVNVFITISYEFYILLSNLITGCVVFWTAIMTCQKIYHMDVLTDVDIVSSFVVDGYMFS